MTAGIPGIAARGKDVAHGVADRLHARRTQAARRREGRRASRRPWKRKAAVVAALALLCALGAAFAGDGDYRATVIGWLPLLMLAAMVAAAFAYLQALKRGLSFSEASSLHDCRRGDEVAFSVDFRNATPLFYFKIDAGFYVSDLFGNVASETRTTLALSPFERTGLSFTARFDHVGTYSAGLSRVDVSDFLGLFTARLDAPARRFVQVTPRLQPIDRLELSNESQLETAKPAHAILADSLDYSSVREYVPGDPLKTVHWKLSARTPNYMTRLFEQTTNPGVAVVLDFYAPKDSPEALMGMFDAVVETGFSVAEYAQGCGMDVEVFFCDRDGVRRRCLSWGPDELDEIVADMPGVTDDVEKQDEAVDLTASIMRNQYGQNNIVVCSANLSARMVSTLVDAKMRRRNPLMFAVVPNGLVGRELEDRIAPLARLDAANVGYRVLARSDELLEGSLR